jgi:hypothetical protein
VIDSHPTSSTVWSVTASEFGGGTNNNWTVQAYVVCVN